MKTIYAGVLLSGALLLPFAAGALGTATPPDFRVGQRWRLSGGAVPGAQDRMFTIIRLDRKTLLAEGRIEGVRGVAVLMGPDQSDNSLAVFDSSLVGQRGYQDSGPVMRVCLFEYGAPRTRFEGVSAYASQNKVAATDFSKLSADYYVQHKGSTFKQAARSIVAGIGHSGKCTLEQVK